MQNIKPLNAKKHFPSIIPIIEDIRHTKLDESAKAEIKKSLENLTTKADSNMLVYELNDQAIAYINFHTVEMPLIQGKEIYITELFIHENYRGKGIGTKLLDKVIEIAKEKGVKRLSLLNSKEIKSYQLNFYKKYGFVERETMVNFIMPIK